MSKIRKKQVSILTVLIINLRKASYQTKELINLIFEKIDNNVYISNCSSRVRINAWKQITNDIAVLNAKLIFSDASEKGYRILKKY